jgi:hypothetical protein
MAVTEEIAEQIKKDADAGMPYKDLTKKYKLNVKDLAKIIKGEELTPPGKPILTTEGFIDYTLTLPAEAFAHFNTAKQLGLIKDHYIGQKVKLSRRPSHWLINYIALVNGLNCCYLLNNPAVCDLYVTFWTIVAVWLGQTIMLRSCYVDHSMC